MENTTSLDFLCHPGDQLPSVKEFVKAKSTHKSYIVKNRIIIAPFISLSKKSMCLNTTFFMPQLLRACINRKKRMRWKRAIENNL